MIPISCDLFCNRDSCGCGPIPGTKDYIIKSLRYETVTFDNEVFQEDKLYDYHQVGLSVEVSDYEFISEAATGNSHNWFVSAAMACDPVPPQSVQKITAISITADSSFRYAEGQEFNLGDDISALFNFNGVSYSYYMTVPRSLFLGENIYVKLHKAPTQATELQFTLKVVLNDQSIHEFQDIFLNIRH